MFALAFLSSFKAALKTLSFLAYKAIFDEFPALLSSYSLPLDDISI